MLRADCKMQMFDSMLPLDLSALALFLSSSPPYGAPLWEKSASGMGEALRVHTFINNAELLGGE